MRILRATDYRRMPWKNGGGETVEIAIAPEGASLESFAWRISMAQVASSGPFSRFPGVDRTLAVLGRSGICLEVAGAEPVALTRETPPFRFSGDEPAEAGLIEGPVEDLNVMTRRASHRHVLSRHIAGAPLRLSRTGDVLFAIVLGEAEVRLGSEPVKLGRRDTLVLGAEERSVEIAAAAPVELYQIEIWRR
jgi:uncharacterized protein